MMQSLMRLRKVIAAFEKNSVNAQDEKSRDFYQGCADYIRQIMTETLQFMTHSEPRLEVRIDGND